MELRTILTKCQWRDRFTACGGHPNRRDTVCSCDEPRAGVMSVSPFRFSGDAGRESLRAIAASLEERGIPAARQRACGSCSVCRSSEMEARSAS